MKTRQELVNDINKELEIFFNDKISHFKDEFFIKITKSLAEYTLRGGKRMRPIFMIYGYQAITGKVTDEIIRISIFLELIQSSLLVHDDIMDDDKLRRGGITIHEKYAGYFSKRDELFGSSIAIIIGDLAMNFAYEIITNSTLSDKKKAQMVSMVSKYVSLVDYGQAIDVKLSRTRTYSEKDIENIHYYKTMIYTTMMPLMVGATIAGASKKQLESIRKYAENAGIAFQIQDDIMGVFGDEKKLGKPIGSDISENKKTLLILKALEKATFVDKKMINNILGKENIRQSEIKKMRKIIINTGSLQYSQDKASKMIRDAKKYALEADIDENVKKELLKIADYIINRDK